MTQEKQPSYESLKARNEKITRIIDQRRDLIDKVRGGEIETPPSSDLDRLERFGNAIGRIDASIPRLNSRIEDISRGIKQEEARRSEIRSRFERIKAQEEGGHLPKGITQDLIATYPFLSETPPSAQAVSEAARVSTQETRTPRPRETPDALVEKVRELFELNGLLTEKEVAELLFDNTDNASVERARQVIERLKEAPFTTEEKPVVSASLDKAVTREPGEEVTMQPPSRKRREAIQVKKGIEVKLGKEQMLLPKWLGEMVSVLKKGQASPAKIGRKLYGPKDEDAKGRIVRYRSRGNHILAPYGTRVESILNSKSPGEVVYELQKPEVLSKRKPKRKNVEYREGVLNLPRLEAEVLAYFSNPQERHEISGLALDIWGRVNSTTMSEVSRTIGDVNKILAGYGDRIVNIIPTRINAVYELRQDAEAVWAPALVQETLFPEAEQKTETLSLNEAAVLANIILQNKAVLEHIFERIFTENEVTLLKEVEDLYVKPQNPMTDEEIIAFRTSILEKLELIYDTGSENELYESAREEIKDFIILILDLEPTYLKDFVNKRVEFIVHTDANLRVLGHETHAYLPHAGRQLTEDEIRDMARVRKPRERRTSTTTSPDIALRPPSYAPRAAEAQPAPIEMPEEPAEEIPAFTPVPAPGAAPHIEEVPAPAEELAPSPSRRETLEEKYHQVITRDPEAIKSINEIIGYIISEMPELWEEPRGTIRPARLTQIFNNVTASFIDDAIEKHTVKPKGGAKRARTELRLGEAAGLAYLKSTQAKNWDPRTKQKAMELVRELVDKAVESIENKKARGQTRAERYSTPQ